YQEYVATSYGGSTMKGINPYVSKAQICTQTGIDCTKLATEVANVSQLTSSGTIDQGQQITLTCTNQGCALQAVVGTDGMVAYTMSVATGAPASQTVEQCESGAGLDS